MYLSLPMKSTTFGQRATFYCLLALFSPISHATDVDTLVGIYSFRSPYGGQEIDVVKVEKEGSQYIAYTNISHAELEWASGEVAQPAKLEVYANLLAEAKFDSSVTGLEPPKMAILRLPAGWRSGPYKADTGFLWISYAGAFEVKKREQRK